MPKRIYIIIIIILLWPAFWVIERQFAFRKGEYLLSGQAANEKYLKACENFDTWEYEHCLELTSKLKGDTQLCQRSTSNWGKYDCLKLRLELGEEVDPEYCDTLKILKDECIELMVEHYHDCTIFTNENNNKDNCYFGLARDNADSKYCELINSINLQKNCFTNMDFWIEKKANENK